MTETDFSIPGKAAKKELPKDGEPAVFRLKGEDKIRFRFFYRRVPYPFEEIDGDAYKMNEVESWFNSSSEVPSKKKESNPFAVWVNEVSTTLIAALIIAFAKQILGGELQGDSLLLEAAFLFTLIKIANPFLDWGYEKIFKSSQ